MAPAIDNASQLYESLTFISSVDHLRLGDQKPESQAGQRVRLAQRPRDHDLFVLSDQVQAIRLGKIGIGFVDQQRAGQSDRPDPGSRSGGNTVPDGTVGIGQEDQLQIRVRLGKRRGQATNRRWKWTSSILGPLDLGQRL